MYYLGEYYAAGVLWESAAQVPLKHHDDEKSFLRCLGHRRGMKMGASAYYPTEDGSFCCVLPALTTRDNGFPESPSAPGKLLLVAL